MSRRSCTPQRQASNIEVIIVDTQDKLADLAKELAKAKVISFDTETTSTEEMQAEIVGISLAVKAGQAYYIPVGHTLGKQSAARKSDRRAHAIHDGSKDRQGRAQCQI